jgi:peptide/nickel transport system substrate-binding protein
MKSCHLRYAFSAGAMLPAVLAMLLALCVGPAYSASEPGTVTIVLEAEPNTLEPGENIRSLEGQVMAKNIIETLTERDPRDSGILPGLAYAWKQIDANTWDFFLRKGVKFHDGEDLNAQAIIFSIKRIYDKRIIATTRGKFFSNVQMEGKALDSHTVEVRLDKPEPLLPTLMSVLPICSPHTPLEKWIRNPVGTGPYRLVKWEAGSQIVLERFDGYWGKQPQVKKAVYVWRTESSVRASMIAIGEADLAPDIAKQDATRPDMDHSYLDSETSFFRIGGPGSRP